MAKYPKLKTSPVLAVPEPREFVDDRKVREIKKSGHVVYVDGTSRPPRKYESADDLEIAIDKYYTICQDTKRTPTISGMQISLGLYETDALNTYCTYSRQHKAVIQKAYLRYTEYIESELMSRKTNCGGLIFVSKNRLGWRDQIEHTHSGEVKHSVIVLPAEQSVEDFNSMRAVAEDTVPVKE